MDICVPIDVKSFIDKEIPFSTRRQFVPLIQYAYELVDAALNDVSFLNWELGKKYIGYLDHLAAQFTLYEAVNSGKLSGIKAYILPNKTKSAYHVELKTDNVVITINRARTEYVTARRAIYRSILQKDNQLYWNFDSQKIKEEPGYLELTHNNRGRKVDFINLGIPDGKGKWFSRIDLTKELHLTGIPREDLFKKNEITREQLVRFKDFAQGVHLNGGKK